jgi:hypothetical protein
LPGEIPNQYQAIRLWPDRMERWTRGYAPDQKRWIADTRCSEDGNEWHTVRPVSFARGAPRPVERDREPIEREKPRDDFLSRVAEVAVFVIAARKWSPGARRLNI